MFPLTTRAKRWFGPIALALWLLLSISALAAFSVSSLAPFDPNQTLWGLSNKTEFNQEVNAYFQDVLGQSSPLKQQVLHIRDKACRCNSYSSAHIRQLNAEFAEYHYTQQTLDTSELANVPAWLPSSPALIIFNENGELAYLGPYSGGLFCSPTSSLANSFVEAILQKRQPGTVVITEAEGCYCATS